MKNSKSSPLLNARPASNQFLPCSNNLVPDTVSHMNFFKRYLFKKALLEDELANIERRKDVVIEKQPEPVVVVEPQVEAPAAIESAPTPMAKADLGGQFEGTTKETTALTDFPSPEQI